MTNQTQAEKRIVENYRYWTKKLLDKEVATRNMAYGSCLSLEWSYEVFTGHRFKDDWDYVYEEFQQTLEQSRQLNIK